VFNFTPVPRNAYRIGVRQEGVYAELLNTDALVYGGSNVGNAGEVRADAVPCHNRSFSLSLTLPPLAALFLKRK
jgi:1,4-alpha-glucan branching enzyme